MLQAFFDSVSDLSLNEQTVHYSESTEVLLDPLYLRFESTLISAHTKFVKKVMETAQKKQRLYMLDRVFEDYQ